MPQRPWLKFYPADWQADELLGMCTLAARGLWIEMIGIMHKADPYGHLVVNGRPPTDTQLAALARCPPDQIPGLLDELENAGVFSRTRTRVIYSRRMTRDERRSKDGRNAKITGTKLPGSRRAQAFDKTVQKTAILKVVDKVGEQPPSPQMPDARCQTDVERTEPNQQTSHSNARKATDGEFEDFWLAYPRKVDRGHALKAYRTAREKASADEIAAGAKRYAKQRAGQEKRFTALASTWLNGERWTDELGPVGRYDGGVIPMHPGAGG